MHLKKYTIASFILIALMGWIGTFSSQTISIELFGINLPTVSVAILIMVPAVILFIASLLHMSFYSIIGNFKLRKYEKDYENMIESIVDAYLGKENRNHVFKTPRYKLLGSLVDNTIFSPGKINSLTIEDDKIRKTLELIEDVNNSKIVDFQKINLSKDNALVIKNDRNKFKNGDITAEAMLGHPNKYNAKLLNEVYIDFVKISPISKIVSYKDYMSKEALFQLLSRASSAESTIELTNESLIVLFEKLDLDLKDYIEISSALSSAIIPEQRIKLFETISETKDEAMDAYLFTLFDLEMIAPADVILDISQTNEYMNFKAYRALRENNKNFNINLFV